jgi:hypothetical protein
MKQTVIFTMIATAILFCACARIDEGSSARDYYHVIKLGIGYSLPIDDPLQWSADNFSDNPGQSLEPIKSIDVDIDHDGIMELFVWNKDLAGQAATTYLVFKKRDEKWRYIGDIEAGRYKVLPLGANKMPRIVVYQRFIAGEGIVVIYGNNGVAFFEIESWKINEENRAKYIEYFGSRE